MALSAKGFTLIELMVVVLIVGILAAVAYPSYENKVREARRSDAKAALLQVLQAEQRYYSMTTPPSYNTNIGTVMGSGNTATLTSQEGYYVVSAAACTGKTIGTCVTLTATPQGTQANDTTCGNLMIDSDNSKTISGTGTVAECW